MTTATSATTGTQRLAIAALGAFVLSVTLGVGVSRAADSPAAGTAEPTLSAPAAATTTMPSGWRRDLLVRVNAHRAAAGLAPVLPCPALRRSAQNYAMSMALTNSFGHTGPGGTAPWDRMRAQGFSWQAAAENIATGQTTVEQVLRAWISSPSHNAILLDPRMEQVGFGFAVDPGNHARTYWVQDFGRGTGC